MIVFAHYLLKGNHNIWVQVGYDTKFQSRVCLNSWNPNLFYNFICTYCCRLSILECSRLRLKCDGTRAETRFRLSTKRTSPFKSAGASVHSTTGSRGVLISGSNAGYTMFRGSVKDTGYPLHSSASTSLPLQCVTVCHYISAGLYYKTEYVSLQRM